MRISWTNGKIGVAEAQKVDGLWLMKLRLMKPLALDHYEIQFLTGHGDFNAKLNSFRRDETVDLQMWGRGRTGGPCPL